MAVVRIGAVLDLVDQVPHQRGVILSGAEDERLLALIGLAHELPHAAQLALPDDDLGVEVLLGEALARLDLALG